jgi:AraC-like DNA-binding protein
VTVIALRHTPAAPLSAFVEAMWCFESQPRPFVKERLMPSGAATLIFNMLDDEVRSYTGEDLQTVQRLPGSALTGPQSQSFVIDTAEQTRVMGIEFHPGGTWPFFSAAADELINQHISLKDLWGDNALSLREQLLRARTPREKFQLLEDALLKLALRPVKRDAEIEYAIRALSYSPQIQTIAALGECMSISARKFSRLFTQQVGLKPKTFARIRRFQRVLTQIGLGREIDWAGVVAQCGYYDQAHFIHDFRAFSGFTPNEYLARRTYHTQHVPLD